MPQRNSKFSDATQRALKRARQDKEFETQLLKAVSARATRELKRTAAPNTTEPLEVDVGRHIKALTLIILAEADDRDEALWLAEDLADAIKGLIAEACNKGWKFGPKPA